MVYCAPVHEGKKYSGYVVQTEGILLKRREARGAGVLAKKLGGGVRPASQNPYPIYDQNLRYSLPY